MYENTNIIMPNTKTSQFIILCRVKKEVKKNKKGRYTSILM